MSNTDLNVFLRLKDELSAEIKKVNDNVKKLDDRFKETSKSATKNTNLLKGSFVDLAAKVTATIVVIRQLGRAVGGMVDAASTVEQFNLRLRQSLGNIDEANKLFEEMRDLVRTAPVEFEEVMGAVVDLSGVTKKGAEEIKELMPIILDISAATGIGVREVSSQMIRIMSAGIGAADMFRDRGVSAMLGFEAKVAVSAENSVERIKEQWRDGTNKMVGAIDNLRDTWKGRMAEMSDALFDFKAEVGGLVSDSKLVNLALKAGIKTIQDTTEEVREFRQGSKAGLSIWQNIKATIDSIGLSKVLTIATALTPGLRVGAEIATQPFKKTKENAQSTNEIFRDMAIRMEEINQKFKDLGTTQDVEDEKRKARFKEMTDEFKAQSEAVDLNQKNITKSITNSVNQWGDSVGSAFANMIVHGKSFTESMEAAFKQMAATFIQQVTAMIAKWLAFKALSAVFGGFFHDGGTVQSYHSGGAIRAHQGLAVDEVPIIAQTGEGILSRRGMAAIGGSGNLNRLNQGETTLGNSGVFNITINNPMMSGKEDVKSLAEEIGFQLQRELNYAGGI